MINEKSEPENIICYMISLFPEEVNLQRKKLGKWHCLAVEIMGEKWGLIMIGKMASFVGYLIFCLLHKEQRLYIYLKWRKRKREKTSTHV